jgi:uncharacterized membrane protein YjjB (DUF3815 family)
MRLLDYLLLTLGTIAFATALIIPGSQLLLAIFGGAMLGYGLSPLLSNMIDSRKTPQ